MLNKLTRSMLLGIGVILSITIIAWLAHAGFGFRANDTKTSALPTEHEQIEMTLDRNGQQAIDTDLYFEIRARATEEGFFSAFPFHG